MARARPDRGWAWMIVLAVTIINLSILPVQQCFGLIFAERFTSLGITATQTSLILHLNGTIACSLGLISGPMMKRFSFRKVAFLGGLTIAAGVCATAFAVSVPAIIVTYCIVVGIGHGIMFPATSLAMNTYFRKKRNIAMGFSVTLTGLGPILMPLLIAKFLEHYATTGTLIILAGIAMHSFVGASLLKPFKEKEITKSNKVKEPSVKSCSDSAGREMGLLKIENTADIKNGGVGALLLNENRNRETWKDPPILSTGNKVDVRNDNPENRLLFENSESETTKSKLRLPENKSREFERKEGRMFLTKIAKNLDLALLKDNRYIAVVLGMGVSLVAETNFNALFPFVLAELSGLERTSIATVMSIQAAFDITGRLFVPLLAQKAGWSSRNLYVISLLGSTLGRTILSTWGNTYAAVIAVAMVVGIAKGTKAVFQALIIPDYVPLDRLPAASGIQMVCNGILSIGIGPLIGLVHDSTDSYVGALHFTSVLSLTCVFLWILGGLWTSNGKNVKLDESKQSRELQEDNEV